MTKNLPPAAHIRALQLQLKLALHFGQTLSKPKLAVLLNAVTEDQLNSAAPFLAGADIDLDSDLVEAVAREIHQSIRGDLLFRGEDSKASEPDPKIAAAEEAAKLAAMTPAQRINHARGLAQ